MDESWWSNGAKPEQAHHEKGSATMHASLRNGEEGLPMAFRFSLLGTCHGAWRWLIFQEWPGGMTFSPFSCLCRGRDWVLNHNREEAASFLPSSHSLHPIWHSNTFPDFAQRSGTSVFQDSSRSWFAGRLEPGKIIRGPESLGIKKALGDLLPRPAIRWPFMF